MKRPMKLGNYSRSCYYRTRGAYKRWCSRQFRRLARRDPENAPRKYRYFGWVD